VRKARAQKSKGDSRAERAPASRITWSTVWIRWHRGKQGALRFSGESSLSFRLTPSAPQANEVWQRLALTTKACLN
jgi:hypothetical protein